MAANPVVWRMLVTAAARRWILLPAKIVASFERERQRHERQAVYVRSQFRA
jgi:hypothetical protein